MTSLLLLILAMLTGDTQAEAKVLWLIRPHDPLKAAYRRIPVGMPTEKACALLGRPADSSGAGKSAPNWEWRQFEEWYGPGYSITLHSRKGRVVEKVFWPSGDGWLDAMRQMAK
jgi:hypothetical protein